jgi:SAM-dependent methyltransferase
MNTTNVYSAVWFDTFMSPIPREQTLAEVDFLGRQLPLASYPSIVDLCCGTGRHSTELAARGYRVLGIDVSETALTVAKSHGGNAAFLNLDMGSLGSLAGPYDGVILLWQSFGYHSAAENLEILKTITALLRPNGRLVLDIYNKDFFDGHQGTMERTRNGERIVETTRMDGERLKVDLLYLGGHHDRFDWEIFTEEQISDHLAALGMTNVLSCTGYSEATPVQKESPRMQIVFEKT